MISLASAGFRGRSRTLRVFLLFLNKFLETPVGFEPPTYGLRTKDNNNYATCPFKNKVNYAKINSSQNPQSKFSTSAFFSNNYIILHLSFFPQISTLLLFENINRFFGKITFLAQNNYPLCFSPTPSDISLVSKSKVERQCSQGSLHIFPTLLILIFRISRKK